MPRRVKPHTPPVLGPLSDAAARRAGLVDTPEAIGRVVTWARTREGLSLDTAAARCGVTKDQLHGLEHGGRGVSFITVLRVLQRLGVDVALLPRDRTASLAPGAPTSVPPDATP
jgi:Helix-turn-helix domain